MIFMIQSCRWTCRRFRLLSFGFLTKNAITGKGVWGRRAPLHCGGEAPHHTMSVSQAHAGSHHTTHHTTPHNQVSAYICKTLLC